MVSYSFLRFILQGTYHGQGGLIWSGAERHAGMDEKCGGRIYICIRYSVMIYSRIFNDRHTAMPTMLFNSIQSKSKQERRAYEWKTAANLQRIKMIHLTNAPVELSIMVSPFK